MERKSHLSLSGKKKTNININ